MSQKSRKTLVVGDIHGNFRYIWSKIKRIEYADIIFAGDVGLGFSKDVYYQEIFSFWDKKLQELNSKVYFMRGNHDNPSFWTEKRLDFPNVKLLQDYDTLQLGDKKILILGGAISIDRTGRTEGLDYWEDEGFHKCIGKVLPLRGITHVISHSSPSVCYPFGFNSFVESWCDKDEKLRGDLIRERKELQDVLEILEMENDIQAWYYGHFHDSWTDEIYGIKFTLLNINEIKEL